MFIIDEKPHSHFKRDGNDLVYTHRLPLVEALSGTELKIPHLDGTTISLPVNEVRSLLQAAAGQPTIRGHKHNGHAVGRTAPVPADVCLLRSFSCLGTDACWDHAL